MSGMSPQRRAAIREVFMGDKIVCECLAEISRLGTELAYTLDQRDELARDVDECRKVIAGLRGELSQGK